MVDQAICRDNPPFRAVNILPQDCRKIGSIVICFRCDHKSAISPSDGKHALALLYELLSVANAGVRGSEKSGISADRRLMSGMRGEAEAKTLPLVGRVSKQPEVNF
jgi:hypothetical protein